MVLCRLEEKMKDSDPTKTIHRIRGILADMNILLVETWFESVDGVFSVQLCSCDSRLMTNGKGTSKQYALASAYGEFMERLQNGVLYRYKVKMKDSDLKYGGFAYAPDEVLLSTTDMLNSRCRVIVDSFCNGRGLSDSEMCLEWEKIQDYHVDGQKNIALPFFSVKSNQVVHLPISILDYKYGTNGMCAGNTPHEAIVQGISEIFERYVNYKIISERITPPTIPDEALLQLPELLELKKRLESSGAYKIIMKDCSLGKRVPVVALILIDLNSLSYFIKFASHPHFGIAFERTLTELLQGRDIHAMKGMTKFKICHNADSDSNKLNIAISGEGRYPDSIFYDCETYPLSELYTSNRTSCESSNSQLMKHMINVVTTDGYDVLIRDVSFLGFPAFQVVVPGMSEITSDNDFAINSAVNKSVIAHTVGTVCARTDIERENLIEILESCGWKIDSPMSFAMLVKMSKQFSWHNLHYGLFRSCVYISLKKYDLAINSLNSYINYLNERGYSKSSLKYYHCIIDVLEGKCIDNELDCIVSVLNKFYPSQIIKDSIYAIENPFANIKPFSCFDCVTCEHQSACLYDEISKFHRIWKDEYRSKVILQERNSNILAYSESCMQVE